MKDTINEDFTIDQAIDIARYLWGPECQDEFIAFQAEFIHKMGFQALTSEYIDSQEAEWITNYLKKDEEVS